MLCTQRLSHGQDACTRYRLEERVSHDPVRCRRGCELNFAYEKQQRDFARFVRFSSKIKSGEQSPGLDFFCYFS